ncbi:MAG: CbiQ family ECF transporter T component [Methylotenera sp.]|uniref:CbiQ family ECF transporter T component n=1 Tax=Methylotenera sp. TaxID=2051956 RepID=UPI002718B215|nr:CbiQ family ECF transporter T component [Methylotenera sp.]MDO9206040.1 CbiQ family ECF transporter T component [Methylotenera sp.]MDO9393398.1 CbiQ family ECF transporter T component [Methylotenera sp.]MDP3308349.1 CbiQ family ECF transporter T component [Methylotenera sp.]MDP3818057.1 CbiQ family ECF transporter T component [Methylotenera sp.]
MHSFVKILVFIFILLSMSFLNNGLVWLLCMFTCIFAAKLRFKDFLRVVKRMRWLFISIFIIYAFGTPGEYIKQFPINFAPTIEGCVLGLLHIAKLLIALATLSLLFSTSSKEQLMTGLYLLLLPLKRIGFNTEQFTARLILTLDYVEDLAVKENFKLSFNHLANMNLATESLQNDKIIILQVFPFKLIDKVIIAILILSVSLFVYLRVFF